MTPLPGRLTITWLPFPLSVTFSHCRERGDARKRHTQREGEVDLARVVADFADIVPDEMRIVRACRSCGSDRHGKPQVIAPSAATPIHVSLGRSGGMTVVAVTDAGPVGVDVEQIQDEDLAPWVRTESLVKATGHGLTIDPAAITDDRWTSDLAAPDGYVAAVTILTATPPRTITNPAAPGA